MAKLKSGSIKLDVGEIKSALYEEFGKGVRLQGKFYDEVERIATESAQELIDEFNKRTSMRESQGSGDRYFRDPDIHRNVHNQPFKTASVQKKSISANKVSVTVEAISTSTKGKSVDVFRVIDEGRDAVYNVNVAFPLTTGSLVKEDLSNVKRVNRIFNPNGVRYIRDKKGRLKMYFNTKLPKIKGRDILGVLARDIEQKLIGYRVRFIKGEPMIGRGLIKVKVKR